MRENGELAERLMQVRPLGLAGGPAPFALRKGNGMLSAQLPCMLAARRRAAPPPPNRLHGKDCSSPCNPTRWRRWRLRSRRPRWTRPSRWSGAASSETISSTTTRAGPTRSSTAARCSGSAAAAREAAVGQGCRGYRFRTFQAAMQTKEKKGCERIRRVTRAPLPLPAPVDLAAAAPMLPLHAVAGRKQRHPLPALPPRWIEPNACALLLSPLPTPSRSLALPSPRRTCVSSR